MNNSNTIINYDQLYEHPQLPFKLKIVDSLDKCDQSVDIKSIYFPAKFTQLYDRLGSSVGYGSLLTEWFKTNNVNLPELTKFCDSIWKTNYMIDISDPKRRVLSIVFTGLTVFFDDLLEKLSLDTTNSRFIVIALESVIAMYETMNLTPLAPSDDMVDEKIIQSLNFIIKLLHQVTRDAVDCFSADGHGLLCKVCAASYRWYSEQEFPIRQRCLQDKRYMTLQEVVETRHLSLGLNLMMAFVYDEQEFDTNSKYYNQYGAIFANIALHTGLTNDVLSLGKELDQVEPQNMVLKNMADGQTLDDAFNSTIQFMEQLIVAIDFLYDLSPSNQKDFLLIYCRIAAFSIDSEFRSNRYGWKSV